MEYKEDATHGDAPDVERMMIRLFISLSEKDRRRYATIEATKVGHGEMEVPRRPVWCDPKTIRQGQAELEGADELVTGRVRKKRVDGNGGSSASQPSRRTS